ncbi:hypothetical protein ACIQTT_05755 [Microbacterium sp. NPDC090225]|uniref:hypothetical protein n=1 Tax=Microbacterium sp. NPDC090225 TaxID=3364207 RepID=UPI003803BDFD
MNGRTVPPTRSFTRLLVGMVAAGSLLGLSACAPEPEPTADPAPTAAPETPEPAAYDGPLHFVGDELDWFLLSADEIAAVVPGAADFSEPSASLLQVADGYGAMFDPETCGVFFLEASLGSIGARSITWQAENERQGRLSVLQFADEGQAERRMDDYVAASEQCATFTFDQSASSFDSAAIDEDGVRTVVGSIELGTPDSGFRHYFGIASAGNVLVEFWHSYTGDSVIDADATARALHARADQAQELLIGELTANPPAPPTEPPAADAAAAWSDWTIGFDGVGPLRLGDDIDTAVATVPDAEVSASEWAPDQRTLTSPDGSASLQVQAQEGGKAVATILAGKIALYGEPPVDGAVLPRAGEIRIGDPIENAMTAFPEGTSVRVVAAGLHFYEVATRGGRVLLFHADRDIATPGATVIGITAEDGTLRREYTMDALRSQAETDSP